MPNAQHFESQGPFGFAKFNKQTTDNLMFYKPFRPEFGLNDINAKKHSNILVL